MRLSIISLRLDGTRLLFTAPAEKPFLVVGLWDAFGTISFRIERYKEASNRLPLSACWLVWENKESLNQKL